MLLDLRDKAGGRVALGVNDSLTAQGADLGATDVEDVAQAGNIGERHVSTQACKTVAEAGAVHKEGQAILTADGGDLLQLSQGVERTVFCGVGNIDHTGLHHMVMAAVGIEGTEIIDQLIGVNFTLVSGDGKYLMSGIFDGSRLVSGNMSGGCGNDTLIGHQRHGDDGRIGLGSTNKETDVRLGALTGGADAFTGACAVGIVAIAGLGNKIGFDQFFQHAGVRAGGVVGFK